MQKKCCKWLDFSYIFFCYLLQRLCDNSLANKNEITWRYLQYNTKIIALIIFNYLKFCTDMKWYIIMVWFIYSDLTMELDNEEVDESIDATLQVADQAPQETRWKILGVTYIWILQLLTINYLKFCTDIKWYIVFIIVSWYDLFIFTEIWPSTTTWRKWRRAWTNLLKWLVLPKWLILLKRHYLCLIKCQRKTKGEKYLALFTL